MRGWPSAIVVAVALTVIPAATAADTSVLYNDYARDRVLSCEYSRADLRAALTDATLNQYGDPYTIIGLKLAVRKQLAGSCGPSSSAAPTERSADDGESSGGGRMLVLGACFVLLVLGAGGWAARRVLTRNR